MMGKYILLLKIQLLNLFGINRILHSHAKKEKRQLALFGIAGGMVIVMLAGYSALLGYGCVRLGLVELMPSIIIVLCSIVTLFLTFMKSSGVLFGMRDYDLIMSLPVTGSIVVLSRLTMVYIMNFLISLITIAPSAIIYAVHMNASVSVCVMLMLTLFFAPLIPMILAMTVGTAITAVSARFRYKNILSLVLSMAAVLTILFFSFSLNEEKIEQFADFGIVVDQALNRFYPPASLLSTALNQNDWGNYALFAAGSIAVAALFTAVTAKFYSKINTAVFSYAKKSDYRIRELQSSSPFWALYHKELKRLLSCTIYILNCGMGAVLFVTAGIALLFMNPAEMTSQLDIEWDMIEHYVQCIPFAVLVFIGMSSTTCVALSLEGKSRWLMCSAPVKAEEIFNSKIAANLTILLPASLMGGLLFSFALKTGFLQTFFMIILPMAYSFFISVVGMLFNVKYPKYDWTSEYYAVKGASVSLLCTMLVGMIMPMLLLGISVMFMEYGWLVQMVGVVLILFVTFSIYQKLRKIRLYA